MESSELESTAPLYLQPIRWAAVLSVSGYYRIAYRIRAQGGLPHRRGSTLVVANHQHEIESPVIVADLTVRSLSWRWPIFTVSSRRMWEPGFFAERIPWLKILRGTNVGWLFSSIGMQPIENELQTRPLVSLAYTFEKRHGDLPVAAVFRERALERFPASVRTLGDLLRPEHFALSRTPVKLTDLLEPYRSQALEMTREELEGDITHFERLARDGATIFLTPEGFYSGDGKMQRLRGILSRLSPLTDIWLAGVSYDPYVEPRLVMLYRVTQARRDLPLDAQLKAVRPITASALLCSWLAGRDAPFSASEAAAAVEAALQQLPRNANVVPELRERLLPAVQSVLDGMVKLKTLQNLDGTYALTAQRTHPQFPRTSDMIAYQANFQAETLDGLRVVESTQRESGSGDLRG